jgi:hypothetical protein
MKLRTRANTLRLRLTQGEVEALLSRGFVEEVTEFSVDERFVVRLAVRETGDAGPRAKVERSTIHVTVPRAEALAWGRGDAIGMHGDQPIGPDRSLSIAIEKDFACLKPRAGEDDTDAFPNPHSKCD